MFVLALLISLQEPQVKDGTTLLSAKYNLTFSIPSKEWGKLLLGKEMKRNWPGSLAEFHDTDENLGGCLTVEEVRNKPDKYADWFETSMEKAKGVREFKRLSSGTAGDWIRRDYLCETEKTAFRYVAVFGARGKANWKLVLWVIEKLWDEKKADAEKIVASFGWLERRIENPWVRVPAGSWAEYKEADKTHRRTLVRKGDKLTFQTESGEVEEELWIPESKKLSEGEEELEVGGKKLKCRWTEVEGGAKIWTCDDVPGALVKRVRGTSTLTLTQFERKP